jgi:hypothetical protein
MDPLPVDSTDDELIACIDRWISLLEQEKYREATAFVDHEPSWTAATLRSMTRPVHRSALRSKANQQM